MDRIETELDPREAVQRSECSFMEVQKPSFDVCYKRRGTNVSHASVDSSDTCVAQMFDPENTECYIGRICYDIDSTSSTLVDTVTAGDTLDISSNEAVNSFLQPLDARASLEAFGSDGSFEPPLEAPAPLKFEEVAAFPPRLRDLLHITDSLWVSEPVDSLPMASVRAPDLLGKARPTLRAAHRPANRAYDRVTLLSLRGARDTDTAGAQEALCLPRARLLHQRPENPSFGHATSATVASRLESKAKLAVSGGLDAADVSDLDSVLSDASDLSRPSEIVVGPTGALSNPDERERLLVSAWSGFGGLNADQDLGNGFEQKIKMKSSADRLYLQDIILLSVLRPSGAPLSFGSVLHDPKQPVQGGSMQCRPCMFERWVGRCTKSWLCDFCHLHIGHKRTRRKQRVANE
uniref:Uncharacterized protein n=1 Tax=Zooxanthella nutricula TaxID=1333877 RepID=A0A6U6J1T5_9DINO|mmetsp:Transcript_20086/g.60139  ORF Transcript_20086/g.60139 Transcript_20086/m.60139 type:complete len:406 (+) Transcript_20086:110-1327(+)